MIRTQIQLTEEPAARLKEVAATEGRSLADVIRESVDLYVGSRPWVDRDEIKARALALTGRFHSGLHDLGSEHDRHLAESLND